jgi:hypothetical protein
VRERGSNPRDDVAGADRIADTPVGQKQAAQRRVDIAVAAMTIDQLGFRRELRGPRRSRHRARRLIASDAASTRRPR